MAEQHAIGGGEGKRVTGRLFPGQMRRLGHELARLHPAELRERAIRRLVAPDPLRRRQQRDRRRCMSSSSPSSWLQWTITSSPTCQQHLTFCADRPRHARRVRAGDVKRRSCAHRAARSAGRVPAQTPLWPDAAGRDAGRRTSSSPIGPGSEHSPAPSHVCGGPWRSLRIAHACMPRRHVAERRHFANVVEILQRRR